MDRSLWGSLVGSVGEKCGGFHRFSFWVEKEPVEKDNFGGKLFFARAIKKPLL